MKKILAIGGSNSSNSINRTFAGYAASLFNDAEVTIYNVSSVDVPLFSVQLEEKIGMPNFVLDIAQQIDQADIILLSLVENNGNLNAGLKNLLDRTSSIKGRRIFGNKPMLLMATSPGARGGASVLDIAKKSFPFQGAAIKNTFSLPSFNQNFDTEKGIPNPELLENLKAIIQELNA